jgi:hypothetical protein
MHLKEVIKSQYQASLAMLKQTIVECPPGMWDQPESKNRFWHVAYHALFYTHLYLQPTESDFMPWIKGRKDYQFMGPTPWPPHTAPEIDRAYSKEELLEYLELVQEQVETIIDTLDFDGQSGFEWLPMGKLELQFYTIRHLQQHTGELCERLGTEAGIEIGWVGMRPG